MQKPATNARDGQKLWTIAQLGVKKAVATSLAFKTLRDMAGDNAVVDPQQLTYVRDLGEGAYAVVELCTLQSSDGKGRPVAVKRLKPEIFQSKEELQHFLDETDLLRRLSHSCIVDFLGVGSTDLDAMEGDVEDLRRKVYLVQEYMNGGTMKSVVMSQMGSGAGRAYTDIQAIDWLVEVAKGLRYLHTSKPKVIHRDIKLENILLKETDAGEVVAKLADFGLHALAGSKAKAQPLGENNTDANLSQLPGKAAFDGELVQAAEESSAKQSSAKQSSAKLGSSLTGKTGSLMYMAPEVYSCQPYDESCDIFSMGTVIFEVCHRKLLMLMLSSMGGDIATDEEFAHSISEGKRPPIPGYWPEKLSALVRRCWEQDKGKRPNADEIVRGLQAIKAEELFWSPNKSGCSCCSLQ
ncbi:hypothetical protein BSKO_13283 [Bryopsis sp. KO-2023]|nr:hypothetical protein BSKO_13283 [Bryopsis sp. KO-2023]